MRHRTRSEDLDPRAQYLCGDLTQHLVQGDPVLAGVLVFLDIQTVHRIQFSDRRDPVADVDFALARRELREEFATLGRGQHARGAGLSHGGVYQPPHFTILH